jgi:glycosyltransferase involved in cell wall biosynthesis
MTSWLLASGDFVPLGGMDTANHAFASYLARRGEGDVHLVAHRVSADLVALPAIHVHHVPRPFGLHSFGEPLLTSVATRRARRVRASGGHVMANGGNVDAGDVSWAHYVHAAYDPLAAGFWNAAIVATRHRHYVAAERRAFKQARLVLCNSARTAEDVVTRVGVDPQRVRRVYYGVDSARFRPHADQAAAKATLGYGPSPLVLFVGALGDRRKGFDTLFSAWCDLCRRSDWDARLVVAGSGAELPAWQARVARYGELADRVTFLGYRTDVPSLMAAADLVVHPARYEAYGLAVHEALCCGVPAVVSASAGVAERLPEGLRGLLLQDVESAAELATRLVTWRGAKDDFKQRTLRFGATLRERTWDDMARDIAAVAES